MFILNIQYLLLLAIQIIFIFVSLSLAKVLPYLIITKLSVPISIPPVNNHVHVNHFVLELLKRLNLIAQFDFQSTCSSSLICKAIPSDSRNLPLGHGLMISRDDKYTRRGSHRFGKYRARYFFMTSCLFYQWSLLFFDTLVRRLYKQTQQSDELKGQKTTSSTAWRHINTRVSFCWLRDTSAWAMCARSNFTRQSLHYQLLI